MQTLCPAQSHGAGSAEYLPRRSPKTSTPSQRYTNYTKFTHFKKFNYPTKFFISFNIQIVFVHCSAASSVRFCALCR